MKKKEKTVCQIIRFRSNIDTFLVSIEKFARFNKYITINPSPFLNITYCTHSWVVDSIVCCTQQIFSYTKGLNILMAERAIYPWHHLFVGVLTLLKENSENYRSDVIHKITHSNPTLFQSYTLPTLLSSNPTLFQSYTLPILHPSNRSYTLPIFHSSNLTLFQSYTLPILHSYNPTIL